MVCSARNSLSFLMIIVYMLSWRRLSTDHSTKYSLVLSDVSSKLSFAKPKPTKAKECGMERNCIYPLKQKALTLARLAKQLNAVVATGSKCKGHAISWLFKVLGLQVILEKHVVNLNGHKGFKLNTRTGFEYNLAKRIHYLTPYGVWVVFITIIVNWIIYITGLVTGTKGNQA